MRWYLDPILNHYVDFEGRANRQQYWMFALFNFVVALVVAMADLALTGGFLYALYAVAVLLPGLAIGVRRLHDTNKSGWMMLLGLIPFVGAVILIVLFVLPGDPGSNNYGPPPVGAPQPGLV